MTSTELELQPTPITEGCEMDNRTAEKNQAERHVAGWRCLAVVLLALLLCGCAARKPAIRPGHDRLHPALTPTGKVVCHTGLLKLFGSYGPRNCVNEKDVKPKQAQEVGRVIGEGK